MIRKLNRAFTTFWYFLFHFIFKDMFIPESVLFHLFESRIGEVNDNCILV